MKQRAERKKHSPQQDGAVTRWIINKMYKLTKDTYKKTISVNARLTHYNRVILPEALYAGECLTMTKKGLLGKLEVRKRRIMWKVLRSLNKVTDSKRRHEELFKHTGKVTDVSRKRRG